MLGSCESGVSRTMSWDQEIRNPKSKIRIPRSEIWDSRAEIRGLSLRFWPKSPCWHVDFVCDNRCARSRSEIRELMPEVWTSHFVIAKSPWWRIDFVYEIPMCRTQNVHFLGRNPLTSVSIISAFWRMASNGIFRPRWKPMEYGRPAAGLHFSSK